VTHTADFIRKREETDSLLVASVLNSSLSITGQFKLGGIVQVAPSFREITTFFDRDTSGIGIVRRDIVTGDLSLSTVIYGMSLFGVGPIERFRQTITPSITFSITPYVEQGRIVNLLGYGKIPPARRYTFTLTNNYEGKTKDGKKLVLVTSQLNLSRDLLNPESKPPMSFNFQMLPQEKINWRFTGSYDLSLRKLLDYSIITQLNFSLGKGSEEDTLGGAFIGPWRFSITHSFSRVSNGEITQRLSWKVRGRLTKHWRFSYSMDFDPESKRVLSQTLNLDRDLHCWALTFNWWIQPGGVWTYNFKVWIKSLPDIAFKRSLFEIFLPK
jgi:hypothetical protein